MEATQRIYLVNSGPPRSHVEVVSEPASFLLRPGERVFTSITRPPPGDPWRKKETGGRALLSSIVHTDTDKEHA